MRGVSFHPAARLELLEDSAYYEERAAGLGLRFIAEVERAVEQIAGAPALGQLISGYTNLRRLPLRRFPYFVIYQSHGRETFVLALAHHRRRPRYWRGRS